MNLMHPASPGPTVNLWFMNGAPVRLVHDTSRYRVVEAEQWPDARGWTLAASSMNGQAVSFSVRSTLKGWELSSAS